METEEEGTRGQYILTANLSVSLCGQKAEIATLPGESQRAFDWIKILNMPSCFIS